MNLALNILTFRTTRLARPGTTVPARRQPSSAAQAPAVLLGKGSLASVQHPLGRTVRCERGSLWLTFDNDCRDVVLDAGARHVCDRDTCMIVAALEDAVYTLY
jgi:hypothetical protein